MDSLEAVPQWAGVYVSPHGLLACITPEEALCRAIEADSAELAEVALKEGASVSIHWAQRVVADSKKNVNAVLAKRKIDIGADVFIPDDATDDEVREIADRSYSISDDSLRRMIEHDRCDLVHYLYTQDKLTTIQWSRIVDYACIIPSIRMAQTLVECSPSMGYFAINRTVASGRVDILEFLLNNYNWNISFVRLVELAIQKGYVKVAKLLFQKTEMDDDFIERMVYIAVNMGHIEIMELLLDYGVASETLDLSLARAAASGRTECVRFLLLRGAAVLRVFAIDQAAGNGHSEALRVLLDWAQGRARDSLIKKFILGVYLQSALRISVLNGHLDAAQLLISRGADPRRLSRRVRAKLPMPRRTGATCSVLHEPVAPGATYRLCVSKIPHATSAEYAIRRYASICPLCKLKLVQQVYINA